METTLETMLCSARDRLRSRGLFPEERTSLSLRQPGSQEYLFLDRSLASPILRNFSPARQPVSGIPAPVHASRNHALIYRLRPDVGAILIGGGTYSILLQECGGVLPMLFDEQARHLGRMLHSVTETSGRKFEQQLASALSHGTNAVMVGGVPVRLGTTSQRMVFNAELFEKCAKAFVLASATGTPVTRIPWWVSRIANGRLKKDERAAAAHFAAGKLPPESTGY